MIRKSDFMVIFLCANRSVSIDLIFIANGDAKKEGRDRTLA